MFSLTKKYEVCYRLEIIMKFSKLCRLKRPFHLIGIFFLKEINLKLTSDKSLGELFFVLLQLFFVTF